MYYVTTTTVGLEDSSSDEEDSEKENKEQEAEKKREDTVEPGEKESPASQIPEKNETCASLVDGLEKLTVDTEGELKKEDAS